MSGTEGDGQQAAAQDTIAPVIETQDDTPPIDPAIEAKARETGWVPKDEYAGDPAKWRPADKWVARGEQGAAENRRLRAEIAELKKTTADTISRIERASAAGLRMQREQIEARYEALKIKAVEQGDTKGYTAVEKMQKDELKKFDTAAEEAKKPVAKANGDDTPSPADQAVMNDWLDDNPWFGTDEDLRYAANRIFGRVEREMPDASLRERLQGVRSRMEEKFPSHFPKKANGNGSPRVESANGRGPEGGSPGGDLWAKVPQEVRAVARNQIEDEGLFHSAVGAKAGTTLTPAQMKQAREMWAKSYFE